jgi:hypothetical protein
VTAPTARATGGPNDRWQPRREGFEANAPQLARLAREVRAMPKLSAVWARKFPVG